MSSIGRRARSLVSVSAAPAVFTGLLGDFFTPIGGAIIVGLLGFIAMALGIQVLICRNSISRLQRILQDDSGSNWWWDGSPAVTKHGFWVAFIFGVICISSAKLSFDDRSIGGFLADGNSSIAFAQTKLLGKIEANTRKIEANTEEIADNTGIISTQIALVKAETSKNPRKELANIGVAWNTENFTEAIELGDLQVLELFLEGGMAPFVMADRPTPMRLAMNRKNPVEVLDVMLATGLDVNAKCETESPSKQFGPTFYTFIGSATTSGNVELVQALVLRGANPDSEMETFVGPGGMVGTITPRQFISQATGANAGQISKIFSEGKPVP